MVALSINAENFAEGIAAPDLGDVAADYFEPAETNAMVWNTAAEVTRIKYPVIAHSPARSVPLSEQAPRYSDNLQGVIGQYLLFSRGVLHLGAYRGMALSIEFSAPFEPQQLTGGDSDQLSLFD